MGQFDFITNEITNYSTKKKASSLNTFNDFSSVQSNLHHGKASKKATIIRNRTSRKITKTRYSTDINNVIDDSVTDVSTSHLDIESSYIDIISTFGVSLIQDVSNSISNKLQSTINTISGIPSETISALWDTANSQIDDIASDINAVAGNYITDYTGSNAKDLDNQIAALHSMAAISQEPVGSFNNNSKTGTTTKNNFFKRDKGNSSCSKYIQSNVPNKAGKLTPNENALKGTPDDKILNGKLKTDNSIVSEYLKLTPPKLPTLPSTSSLVPSSENLIDSVKNTAKNTYDTTTKSIIPKGKSDAGNIKSVKDILPSMPKPTPNVPSADDIKSINTVSSVGEKMGFTAPLTPNKNSTAISEPKPTPEKAEYGKIQVKETKAGFVDIVDETPGNQRKISQHPTGSYEATLNDGSVHKKITKNRQEITDGDWKVTTSKDKVEIVIGDSKIEIRKNDFRTIHENNNIDIGGDSNILIKGDVKEDIKGSKTEKIGENNTSSVAGNRNDKTDGNYDEKIGGNQSSNITGNLTITVTGNVNINSSGQTTINSSGPATISSTAIVRISAPKVSIG